ncbi:TonB-dependent receptor [Massilia oculi]|uniref:TonB-dependent receptor n=1 Tax=Massilia hydrophila TaxID=3044279 RepID=A0ABS7YGK5_9BURK|nr:TonB-dependent receptor [Massilia oculi]MCA1857379.1 TonB-dependent receptor [Massilia oculi]
MFLKKRLSPIALAILTLPAGAQSVSDSPAASDRTTPDLVELSQVIVTARKVGERLQDVPLSIRALTDKELEARGINSLSDLSLFTPGLSYSADYGRVLERPVIRGISALRPEAPQPVSVFVDGVFVRDAALSLLMDDARRIEVIKGPQSALYGRSTYAGAINYVTEEPGEHVDGKISATVAEDGERSLFGAVTLPLSDTLSARFRAKTFQFGGQYTNAQTGAKIGNERTRSAGIDLMYRPAPNFDARLALDFAKDRDGMFAAVARTIPIQAGGVVTNQNGSTNVPNGGICNGRVINIVGNNPVTGLPDPKVPATAATLANGWPCGPATFSGTTLMRNQVDLANYTDPATGIHYGDVGGLDRKMKRGALTLNYRFGGGQTLTSQTAYTDQDTNLGADQSFNATRFAPGFGFPATSWLTYDRDKLRYFSQELRLASAQDQAFSWLVGAFYYREEGEGMTTSVLAQDSRLNTIADRLRPKPSSEIESIAPFARIQYVFNDRFKMSLEGRYNRERVTVGGTPIGTAVVNAGTCTAGQPCSVDGSHTFKDFTPRLTLDYKLGRDVLLYAQAATGSKSGGFNMTPGLAPEVVAYDGEDVKSVEIGVKSEFLQRRMRVNVALFNNDIEGLQLSNLALLTNPLTGTPTTTTIVNNVGKARSRGAEVDVMLRAARWLTLSGNYAYTDAKAITGTESTNGTVYGGNQSVAGFYLPRSPKHSAAASAEVVLPTPRDGVNFFARTDVVYQSRRYAEIQNTIWGDDFTRVNASLGLQARDWRLTAFVKNATNDDTSLNGFRYLDPATFRRMAVDFLPRLRQYGISASYSF